jgi:hypothetical protein
MRAAIRWAIAITLTIAAFGLATWLSVVVGADEGWALAIGALVAALALAVAQAWATSHHPPNSPAGAPDTAIAPNPPAPPAAPETPGNSIGGSATIAGTSIQVHKVAGGVHVHPPAPQGRAYATSGPEYPIRVGDVPQRPPAFQPREELFDQLTAAKPVAVVQALTGARGVGQDAARGGVRAAVHQ